MKTANGKASGNGGAERAAAGVDARQRQRDVLTAGAFLRAQGPPVVLVDLPVIRKKVMLRRVDLVALASGGAGWPAPISSAVMMMVRQGGLRNQTIDDEHLGPTMRASAAIAQASAVVPPPAYMAGEIELEDIVPAMLKPLFVPNNPDEDQAVLEWIAPEEEAQIGQAATELAVRRGRLHWRDLAEIAAAAYVYGPGGVASIFPVRRDSVDAGGAVEAPAAAPERGAADRVPVGRGRSGSGGGVADRARPKRARARGGRAPEAA